MTPAPRALRLRALASLRALPAGLRRRGPARPLVDPELPRLVPLAFLAIAPFVLSGPVRAVTSLPLGGALAVALAVTALGAAVCWRVAGRSPAAIRPTGHPRLRARAFELVVLAPALWAAVRLYNPDFDGFPTIDGWDAGSHVAFERRFVRTDPADYHGFVALYAFVRWCKRILTWDAFRGFSAGFHLTVVGYAAAPLAIAVARVRAAAGASRAALACGLGAAVATSLWTLDRVGLPLLHYNQAMGFYAHLFGLLPLALLWGVDALVRVELLRVTGLLAALGIIRYTYGLNLADLLVTTAIVIVLGAPPRARLRLHLLVAAGLLAGAYHGFVKLVPLLKLFGWLVRFDMDRALSVDLGVAGALGLAIYLRRRAAVASSPRPEGGPETPELGPLVRALRLPLVFALVSSAAFAHLRGGGAKEYYYLAKYQVWACLLLAGACVVAAGEAATFLARLRARWRDGAAIAAVACVAAAAYLGPVAWGEMLTPYRASYEERIGASAPPYVHVRPVADREALARIDAVLTREGKRFGGYLTTWFPMFSFMNAMKGHHTGVQEFFPPRTAPGHCVFWVPPERDLLRLGPAHVLDAQRAGVAAGPGATCETYAVPWKTPPHGICHRCY